MPWLFCHFHHFFQFSKYFDVQKWSDLSKNVIFTSICQKWIKFDGPFRSKNCPRKRQYLIEWYIQSVLYRTKMNIFDQKWPNLIQNDNIFGLENDHIWWESPYPVKNGEIWTKRVIFDINWSHLVKNDCWVFE